VDESENFYVRHDNFPVTAGHVEIVPKRHVVSYFDLSPAEMSEAHALMQRVQRKLNTQYKPDGYTIGVNDGRAAGRTVDHLHIHLIPRHVGDVSDPRGGIRQNLPNYHPDLWRTAD
jgi:diadenosine tetraphosphate (Ap4A) HIT family hydrolase